MMERSLSRSLTSSLYHGAAGLILVMMGALLLEEFPFSWSKLRTEPVSSVFCPQRSAPYSVTTELYQSFVERTDVYGKTVEVVQQILGTPACLLPSISIRSDVVTERQVYYIDSGLALVLAYEEGVFVGYSAEGDPLPDTIQVAQSWSVSSGDNIGGYTVLASLGELSLSTQDFVQAPELGTVSHGVKWSKLSTNHTPTPLSPDCVTYTSHAYPTYLFRLCGLRQSRSGLFARSDRFGQVGGVLHFALLSLRPTENQSKQWHYVAPSPEFITQFF